MYQISSDNPSEFTEFQEHSFNLHSQSNMKQMNYRFLVFNDSWQTKALLKDHFASLNESFIQSVFGLCTCLRMWWVDSLFQGKLSRHLHLKFYNRNSNFHMRNSRKFLKHKNENFLTIKNDNAISSRCVYCN
jgi:hypothetical protein